MPDGTTFLCFKEDKRARQGTLGFLVKLDKVCVRWFAQPFPHVCGESAGRNWPREAVSITSNMFDIFGQTRQISHCVRPS